MKRHAISSYCPGAPYQDYHWPESGLALWDDVFKDIAPERRGVMNLATCRGGCLHWQEHACWVIVALEEDAILDNEGMFQFVQGEVICHARPQITYQFLRDNHLPLPCYSDIKVGEPWQNVKAGNGSVAIAGYDALAEAGDYSIASVVSGSAIAGEYGRALAHFGTAHAKTEGIAISDHCDATSGERGIAIACSEFQTATVGDDGLAIASFDFSQGTAIAGKQGIALTRCNTEDEQPQAHVQAGEGGILAMLWHDGQRLRLAVAYVGESGILPDTPYTLTNEGRFVPKPPPRKSSEW